MAAPGLVELREFYSSLGDRVFHSTQYVRHPSQPLYTPEPDVIHEVLGHGNQLASQRFAEVTRAAGAAVARAERDETVQVIADVFWFTMEFGVMYDRGELKAYGAGICSSYGEIDEFTEMEIRPLELTAMATQHYDITTYQPVLFAARVGGRTWRTWSEASSPTATTTRRSGSERWPRLKCELVQWVGSDIAGASTDAPRLDSGGHVAHSHPVRGRLARRDRRRPDQPLARAPGRAQPGADRGPDRAAG